MLPRKHTVAATFYAAIADGWGARSPHVAVDVMLVSPKSSSVFTGELLEESTNQGCVHPNGSGEDATGRCAPAHHLWELLLEYLYFSNN